jgi:hypothetical protein
MLLVPAPKNRTIVRNHHPRAKIEAYIKHALNGSGRFFIVDRPRGTPISAPCLTRSKAWKDAAQRIALREEALRNDH